MMGGFLRRKERQREEGHMKMEALLLMKHQICTHFLYCLLFYLCIPSCFSCSSWPNSILWGREKDSFLFGDRAEKNHHEGEIQTPRECWHNMVKCSPWLLQLRLSLLKKFFFLPTYFWVIFAPVFVQFWMKMAVLHRKLFESQGLCNLQVFGREVTFLSQSFSST